jgi:predicted amidohydrolase
LKKVESTMRGSFPAGLTIIWAILQNAPAGLAGAAAEPDFVVAAMRVQPKPWDKAHNFALLERYAKQAAAQGARLVVTCEGFLDGYTSNPKLTPDTNREKFFAVGESLDGNLLQRVGRLARELKIYLSVGFAERRGDNMHNTVAVFSPDGDVALRYSKTHSVGEPFNTPGSEFPVAATDLGTLGALICYDRRFPEVPRILALKGAQILLVPAYGKDGERNEALLRTRAWENSVWVVYVRQSQVLIINPSGKIIARDKGQGDELVFARIDLGGEKGTGEIYERRSPEIYRELLEYHVPARP